MSQYFITGIISAAFTLRSYCLTSTMNFVGIFLQKVLAMTVIHTVVIDDLNHADPMLLLPAKIIVNWIKTHMGGSRFEFCR